MTIQPTDANNYKDTRTHSVQQRRWLGRMKGI